MSLIDLVLGSEASPGLPVSWDARGLSGHRVTCAQDARQPERVCPVDRHIGLKTWPQFGGIRERGGHLGGEQDRRGPAEPWGTPLPWHHRGDRQVTWPHQAIRPPQGGSGPTVWRSGRTGRLPLSLGPRLCLASCPQGRPSRVQPAGCPGRRSGGGREGERERGKTVGSRSAFPPRSLPEWCHRWVGPLAEGPSQAACPPHSPGQPGSGDTPPTLRLGGNSLSQVHAPAHASTTSPFIKSFTQLIHLY